MKTLLKSLPFLALIACSTPMVERFNDLELGMDKTDVLDEVGSPNKSFRQNELDIWLYSFHTDATIEQREINFKNEFVSYVGEPRPRNEAPKRKTEEEAAATLEKEIKRNKKSPSKDGAYKDVNADGSF